MDIGLDVHKKMSYYSMVDRQGTEVKKGRFPTTRETFIVGKFSQSDIFIIY